MAKTRVKRLYNSPSGGKIPNNLRLDGTKKGKGFAQIRKPNQPTTMTEYSIGRLAQGKSPFYNQKDDVLSKYKKGK